MNLLTQKDLMTINENYKRAINKLSIESFDVYRFLNKEFKTHEDAHNECIEILEKAYS